MTVLSAGLRALRVMAALGLAVLLAALLVGTLPRLAGWQSFVVLGGSMEPTLHNGDLVVVTPGGALELAVGDVITFQTVLRGQPIIATHRIVGVVDDPRTGLAFQTRGDANPVDDPAPVPRRAVLGRVAYGVPRVGHLVTFARQPAGQGVLIGLPTVLLAVGLIIDVARGGPWAVRGGVSRPIGVVGMPGRRQRYAPD